MISRYPFRRLDAIRILLIYPSALARTFVMYNIFILAATNKKRDDGKIIGVKVSFFPPPFKSSRSLIFVLFIFCRTDILRIFNYKFPLIMNIFCNNLANAYNVKHA